MKQELIRLAYFAEIAKSIVRAHSVKDTLDLVMEHINEIFEPGNWSVLLKDNETGDLVFKLVVGEAADSLLGTRVKKGKGIAGWVVDNAQSLIIEDVESDTRFFKEMDKQSGFTTKSIIAVPLRTEESVYGVIELINKLDGSLFSDLDLKLLATIAEFAGIALEKAYYQEGLRKIAHIDPLTKLYNRRLFEIEITNELERIKRGGRPFSLLFIDADKFKEINDNHGHVAGDNALKCIAGTLMKVCRREDNIYRFGGDEFIVLMPNSNEDTAANLKQRILDQLADDSQAYPFTISVSIGVLKGKGETVEDIIQAADEDMYLEKIRNQEAEVFDISKHIGDSI